MLFIPVSYCRTLLNIVYLCRIVWVVCFVVLQFVFVGCSKGKEGRSNRCVKQVADRWCKKELAFHRWYRNLCPPIEMLSIVAIGPFFKKRISRISPPADLDTLVSLVSEPNFNRKPTLLRYQTIQGNRTTKRNVRRLVAPLPTQWRDFLHHRSVFIALTN